MQFNGSMYLLIKYIIFIFFYVGSSLSFFLAISRLARIDNHKAWPIFLISAGLGPVFTSWVLTRTMILLPGQSNLFYLGTVVVFTLLVLAWGWNVTILRELLCSVKKALKSPWDWSPMERILGALLAVVLSANVFLSMASPVTENDAIQYLTVVQIMFKRHSLEFYPVIKPMPNGFYAISCHPVGFMGIHLWTYILQGSSGVSPFVKMVSPLFVLFTLSAFWGTMEKYRPFYPLIASLILICTPCYFIQSSQLGIDSFRIYLLLASVLWMLELCKRPKPDLGFAAATGLVAGLSMFSHAIGVLFTLPLILPIYFLYGHRPWRQWFEAALVITVVAILLSGYRIIENILLFGAPIYDHLQIYDLENIRYDDYVWYGARLLDEKDKIIRGLLKGFTNLKYFGLSYWFSLGMILVLLFKDIRHLMDKKFLHITGIVVVILLFYGAVLLTYFLNMHVFIAHFRYLMTIQPLIAMTGAIFMGIAYEKMESSL